MRETIHVVGGGLAGCEAALQLVQLGFAVTLHEMRPERSTPAHRTGDLAEIVCSNSLKSLDRATASGLLKLELDLLGCQLLQAAHRTAVPAGAALAVDRELFASEVERLVVQQPNLTVVRDEVTGIDTTDSSYWILATGPLTSPALQEQIGRLTGGGLHFFDAIAPSVTAESLDLDILFRAARYDRGEADYLNAPLDEATYRTFHTELVQAEKTPVHDFDRAALFAGCQPIEEIAASGPDSLAFGPLRPVGLTDPRTGRRPFAVVQLRQENRAGSLYGLVGFQTRLKYGEQKRVFRLIPGLAQGEFVRLGQMHRNFYLDTPRSLNPDFSLPGAPTIRVAGQITGVEGYVESIASGLLTAWLLAAELRGIELPPWPPTTLMGALHCGFLFDTTSDRLTPMNVNFGLLPPLSHPVRGKRPRRLALTQRALDDLQAYLGQSPLRRLLAERNVG
jgi:methylenetetrahydrofolate--tRNA-(uracil-5-)-methyltransferase